MAEEREGKSGGPLGGGVRESDNPEEDAEVEAHGQGGHGPLGGGRGLNDDSTDETEAHGGSSHGPLGGGRGT